MGSNGPARHEYTTRTTCRISMVNPEKEQDRVQKLFDRFNKHGICIGGPQRRIYENLREVIKHHTSVLEAGCGVGVGTAIMYGAGLGLQIGTDKVQRNVDFARQIHPRISFEVWDITNPPALIKAFTCAICVEAIEHIEDIEAAIKNLCDAARKEVWISTPNGDNRPQPPKNLYHVREYTVTEMLKLLSPYGRVIVRDWQSFDQILEVDTVIDPLVYQVHLK